MSVKFFRLDIAKGAHGIALLVLDGEVHGFLPILELEKAYPLGVKPVCDLHDNYFSWLFAVLMEEIRSFLTSMHCSKIARSS